MLIDNITWLGHASFRIESERVIYIDPWKVSDDALKADIILISHAHFDHCSPIDVKKLVKSDTQIFGPADAFSEISGTVITPGETVSIGSIQITATPSYNINKLFHPRANNWMGFGITLPEGSVYYAGDSDHIPEMKGIAADIALLPVSGTYTMDPQEAVDALSAIETKIVIPYHWGDIFGTREDAVNFKQKCPADIECVIKEVER